MLASRPYAEGPTYSSKSSHASLIVNEMYLQGERFAWPVSAALCLCALLGGPRGAQSAPFQWATPSAGQWDEAGNWTPSGGPPAAGDTAAFNQPAANQYTVSLTDDEGADGLSVIGSPVRLEGTGGVMRTLTISPDGGDPDADIAIHGGGEFEIGQRARIEGSDAILAVGVGSDGGLILDGPLAGLTANGSSHAHAVGDLGGAGALSLVGGAFANIGNQLNAEGTLDVGVSDTGSSTGAVSVAGASALGVGNLNIGTRTSSATGVVTISSPGSVLSVSSATTVGSATGGTGLLTVEAGAIFDGIGTTTVRPTGTIDIAGGLFSAEDDVVIDGGTLNKAAGAAVLLRAFTSLIATNDAQVTYVGPHTISDGETYEVRSGADFVADDLTLSGFQPGSGLIVDGVGSTLTADSLALGAGPSANGGSVFTLGGQAIAQVAGAIDIGVDDNPTLNQMIVESSAQLTVGDLRVGVGAGAQGVLQVSTGGAVTQAGAAEFRVGSGPGTAPGTVGLFGGTLTTGTGPTTVDASGTVSLLGGVLNANGDVVVDGGTLTVLNGLQLNLATGRTLTAINNAHLNFATTPYAVNNLTSFTIDSGARFDVAALSIGGVGTAGAVHLAGGRITATQISLNPNGVFNFTGGALTVGTYNGDLMNQGGVLDPGDAVGQTTIAGDYAQQTGATLAIEIGGPTPATQHDFVEVTGDATLGGELRLTLTDGFTPTGAEQLVVLDAGAPLSGEFANVLPGGRLGTTDLGGSFVVNYGAASPFDPSRIVLSDFVAIALPGDYNDDGVVDAADFTVWRDVGGQAVNLPNDLTPGFAGGDDLPVWMSQYGQVLPTAVAFAPEPGTAAIVTVCGALIASRPVGWRGRSAKRKTPSAVDSVS